MSWWRRSHIHRAEAQSLAMTYSVLANGKEKCASMINGHDYLLRKCGFLAQQQLHFYNLNLEGCGGREGMLHHVDQAVLRVAQTHHR